MRAKTNPAWPVLTTYDQDHLTRLAMPLGGIGTGTISLGGRGDLRDWELCNRPAKGYGPQFAFFSLLVHDGNQAVGKVLEGPIEPPYDSENGFRGTASGLPRFREARFCAAYPLGQVLLQDRDVPIGVRLEAFNPLIPGDADSSGLPVVAMRYVLSNSTDRRMIASVCGSLSNFVGGENRAAEPGKRINEVREGRGARGIVLRSEGTDPQAEQWGTVALSTAARSGLSYRTAWMPDVAFFEQLLDFWDDFVADGRLEERQSSPAREPVASLAVRVSLPPHSTRSVPFLLTWHFPNRRTWSPSSIPDDPEDCIGNYYTTHYADAWDAAVQVAPQLGRLEQRTVEFVRAFCDSDLPQPVREAALNNLSTLRTQTCFRTPDGRFYGWEGSCDGRGCCPGSCTHVWNYEQATGFLFGDLARGMREVEFLHQTREEDGFMPFRFGLPLGRPSPRNVAAADGQMGCIMKLYREWQLCGDADFLRRLWPRARRALEFAWIPGGWDADQDGVMEGCQHNTTDLEFYGPNPLMAGWYLGALRAAEEMGRYLGEECFADRCAALYRRGSVWVDTHLFNGEYYEQQVRPPESRSVVAQGLSLGLAAGELSDPPQQVGTGCMTDQLVGQFMAHVCGLGRLLQASKIRTALRSIMRHNFLPDQFRHVNTMRAFTLNNEAMLTFGTYPRGGRPARPCFRFSENWTGIEYAAAALMVQEGQASNALKVVRAVRERFDGRKRSPFDEPECGHHYARAMASWGLVVALTGFRYSAVEEQLQFAAATDASTWFWSAGNSWGTISQRPRAGRIEVELRVNQGSLRLKTLSLTGAGSTSLPRRRVLTRGRPLTVSVQCSTKKERTR